MSVLTQHLHLQPGDRITFAEERNSYTVQAVSSDGRWAAATKPFHAQDTVLYTVIDFAEQLRGQDNSYCLGYETREQCERAISLFEAGRARHSHRHPPIDLHITRWVSASAVRAKEASR